MISLFIILLFNRPINELFEQYIQVEARIKVREYKKYYYKNNIANIQLNEIIEKKKAINGIWKLISLV